MPTKAGSYHKFQLASTAIVTGPNAACGVCLDTKDRPVHQPPLPPEQPRKSRRA